MSDIGIIIRGVRPEELDRVAAIEAACFPAAEAASPVAFKNRIAAYPECFLVAESGEKLIGFVNGCVTDSPVIYDELFHDTDQHRPQGANLAIFGLDVLPEYRRRGIAARLMREFIELARKTGRRSVILTCKERLVPYYESFGYVNLGVSESTHGGARWYDMTLTL